MHRPTHIQLSSPTGSCNWRIWT